jgi:hypothetical protein
MAVSDLAGRVGSNGCRRWRCVQIAKEPTHHSQYPTRWIICARRSADFRRQRSRRVSFIYGRNGFAGSARFLGDAQAIEIGALALDNDVGFAFVKSGQSRVLFRDWIVGSVVAAQIRNASSGHGSGMMIRAWPSVVR